VIFQNRCTARSASRRATRCVFSDSGNQQKMVFLNRNRYGENHELMFVVWVVLRTPLYLCWPECLQATLIHYLKFLVPPFQRSCCVCYEGVLWCLSQMTAMHCDGLLFRWRNEISSLLKSCVCFQKVFRQKQRESFVSRNSPLLQSAHCHFELNPFYL
jgi:hypothetical protein